MLRSIYTELSTLRCEMIVMPLEWVLGHDMMYVGLGIERKINKLIISKF